MKILGIDHLELYVGDARQAAYLLCSTLGFRVTGEAGPATGRPDQSSLLLRHGDTRLVLTTGLTADHPASRYVAAHGDGVAVVALATDDVAASFDRAIGNGAAAIEPPTRHVRGDDSAVTAMVSGFGDVTHRLIERHGPGGRFLPGLFDEIAADPESGDEILSIIDHLAICLPAGELATTSRFYQEAFGFDQIFSEYIEVGTQGMDSAVVQCPSRLATFTFLEPDTTRRPGQIDDFLQWHGGAGVQHVAFLTDDIITAVRTFGARGIRFADTPATYYDMLEDRLGAVDLPLDDLRELGVLVDRDHGGQMFQIFTQSMHVRRTYFLEVIERHGALTFGSSNIKALYEAKERELALPGSAH